MLHPPHTQYNRLFVYYFDRLNLPPLSDPDLIGTWIEDDCAILFFHRAKDELVQRICAATGAQIIYQADLDYRDWEAGTVIGSFATRELSVRPVWECPAPGEKDGRTILLDPSVIFGSGFHATTRLCLETLENVLLETDARVNSVIDLGTGTGLLAIAAAKLGVGKVVAVDNNPLACEVARRNIARNHCNAQVSVVQADLKNHLPELDGYDLVVANLYKGLLLSLFGQPGFWRSKMYMISGFIAGMEGDLLAALPLRRLQVLQRDNRDMWRLWLLKNRQEDT